MPQEKMEGKFVNVENKNDYFFNKKIKSNNFSTKS